MKVILTPLPLNGNFPLKDIFNYLSLPLGQPEYERIRRFQLCLLSESNLLNNLLVKILRLAVVNIQIASVPAIFNQGDF